MKSRISRHFTLLALLLIPLAIFTLRANAATYDPLATNPGVSVKQLRMELDDSRREREVPIRVFLPSTPTTPLPVILFSHGLGGSREGNDYLGNHWANRGFVVVFLQHPGSDESIWKDLPPARRIIAFKAAANARQAILRMQDVTFVIDQLELHHLDRESPLHQRLSLERVGMSGHSFGAITTQGVSGFVPPFGMATFQDARIAAALPMSPSLPQRSRDPEAEFAGATIPWLLMTGTHDLSIIGGADLESRLGVFPALPAGDKYEVVFNLAEHSAFTDRALPGDRQARNPNHHRSILALSTAFWESYLKDDAAAKTWLTGSGPRTVLEAEDRWQTK